MNIQDRIKMVIKMHNLSSSAFADKIGVQRSSVSHILTGRNNPSLDFIEKTLISFPRVNADWLIMGKASNIATESSHGGREKTYSVVESEDQSTYSSIENKKTALNTRSIDRIVVFYSDGTFEETRPSKTVNVE